MKVTICDRCDEIINGRYFTISCKNSNQNFTDRSFDLCEKCYEKFLSFMKGE